MSCLNKDCNAEWEGMNWVPEEDNTDSSWESVTNATTTYSYPSYEIYSTGILDSSESCFGNAGFDGSSIRQESISDLDLTSELQSYPTMAGARLDGTSSQPQYSYSEILPGSEYSMFGLDAALAQPSQGPTRSDAAPCACNTEIAGMRSDLDSLRKELWDLRQKSDRRSTFDKDMKNAIEEYRKANKTIKYKIREIDATMNRLWSAVENWDTCTRSLAHRVKDLEIFLGASNEVADGAVVGSGAV